MKKVKKVKGGNKIKIKEISQKTKRVFAESDVLVMLEDMNDNIKILAEGLMGTNEKLDTFEQNVNERFDNLESEFHGFKNDTENNFKMVFEYLSHFDDELVEIKEEIKFLHQELKTRADLDQLELLEKRVRRLEQNHLALVEMGKK